MMIRAFIRIGLGAVLVVLQAAVTLAQPVTHVRLDRSVDRYVIARDLTFVETGEQDMTLLTQRGLRAGERASRSFYPDKQALEVVEAWVDQPDGTRIMVPPGSIFTRPSAASQNAPGFTGSLTTTVLFPQLREGSRTHVVWKRTQKVPPLLGVNVTNQAMLEWATGEDTTEIEIPADVAFHWRARGGFTVEETVIDGVRRIRASIRSSVFPRGTPYGFSTRKPETKASKSTTRSVKTLGELTSWRS